MDYCYRKEYLELCSKYFEMVYDFVYFACGVPVYLWNYISHVIYEWGWCASNPAYTEFVSVLFFLIAWVML